MSRLKGDRYLWFITIGLSIFSLLVVYSSTGMLAFKAQGGNTEYYLFKHFTISFGGLVLMWAIHKLNYRNFTVVAKLAYIVSIPLLLYTMFKGSNLNEASRWIAIPGTGLTFQTSDFAKLALVLFVARLLAKNQDQIKEPRVFWITLGSVVAISALIVLNNFSTAFLLLGTGLVMMFFGRISTSQMTILVLTGILFMSLSVLIVYKSDLKIGRSQTWKKRIENYMNGDGKEEQYQTLHSKMAISNGGFIGVGPGNSDERNYLPHPYSDMVFAIIVEEYGLVGGAMVLFTYIIIFQRAIRIARKCATAFGAFLAIGLSFSLVVQAFVNMAVAADLFPVTGQPLPLVSMGGTSVLFTCAALGIIQSVARDIEEREAMEDLENVVVE